MPLFQYPQSGISPLQLSVPAKTTTHPSSFQYPQSGISPLQQTQLGQQRGDIWRFSTLSRVLVLCNVTFSTLTFIPVFVSVPSVGY